MVDGEYPLLERERERAQHLIATYIHAHFVLHLNNI
jgi:hypothetical protein